MDIKEKKKRRRRLNIARWLLFTVITFMGFGVLKLAYPEWEWWIMLIYFIFVIILSYGLDMLVTEIKLLQHSQEQIWEDIARRARQKVKYSRMQGEHDEK